MENKLKRGLGRGLSSLLGDNADKRDSKKVYLNDLVRNQFQPRKYFSNESLQELTESIKEQGVIQPIVVRPSKESSGKYEIIAGERRWIASQKAGLKEVPIIILNIDDLKSLELAIVENVQRQDLNPIEEARGYKRLMDDFKYDQEKLCKFIAKSRSYIANSLRLLNLPEEVQIMVEQGSLSSGHARSLVGLTNSKSLAKEIINKKLSVRQVESLVKKFRNNKNIKLVSKKDSNILDLEKSLEEKTGLKVYIQNNKNNAGKIYFEYRDLEQLEFITKLIKNER